VQGSFCDVSVTPLNSERARSLLDKDARVSAQNRGRAGAHCPGLGPSGPEPAQFYLILFLFLFQQSFINM
jgi:hypothetical protein